MFCMVDRYSVRMIVWKDGTVDDDYIIVSW
jgi:hypothetical protein